MNAISPRSDKRRQVTPLMWAGGGTVLLHGALLTLLLWPHAPAKPREALLEVDLTHDKPQKIALAPTPAPPKPPKRLVAPPPTPLPLPTAVSRPPVRPQIAPKPRVAVQVPKPRPKPIPIPVKAPAVAPTPVPLIAPTKAPENKVPKLPTKSAAAAATRRTPRTISNGGSSSKLAPTSKLPAKTTASNPLTADDKPAAPSGGAGGRRFASNDEPIERGDGAGLRNDAPASSNKGSNARGHSDETAGAQPGLDLPRTPSHRGRRGSSDAPSGSAPTVSKDGTEVNIGPSAPTFSSGGSRLSAPGVGGGENDSGPARGGGLPRAEGSANVGNANMGRGADEAAGEGVHGGTRGSGARGHAKGGRSGSRLAGDPFGNNEGGNGGYGKGNGAAGDGGTGNGPRGGTRLARGGIGIGDSDGDGDGKFGRGPGQTTGTGQGPGTGGTGRDTSTNNGRGGNDTIKSDGNGNGAGRARNGRGRGGHRAIETEVLLGRGIWGGFALNFYQDKARYPDNIDTRTIQGKPIDWSTLTGTPQKMTSPNLSFDWGTTPPVPGMKSTFWSMKATGRIFVPKDDTYKFYFDKLDDAGRLYLDGEKIIDIWRVQQSTPSSYEKRLIRGAHDIKIEYVQGPATAASIQLSWSSTSFSKEIVGVYKAPDDK